MKKELFWFQNLNEGMIQSADTSLTKGSELLKNMTLDQIGNYSTRLGSGLVANKIGTEPGFGLWDYNSTDGSTKKLMAVTDRDLYVYDEGGGTWGSAVDTDEWTANKKVNGTDYLNRSYIGCEDGTTALSYSTGGAITDVAPTIGGHILSVNKDILAVGGNSLFPNVMFHTDPFTDRFHRTLGVAKAATATCRPNVDEDGTNYVAITSDLFPADIEGAFLYNTNDTEMAQVIDWVPGSQTVSTKAAVITDGVTDISGWNDNTIYVLQNFYKMDNACTASISYNDNFISFDEYNMYIWDPTVKPHGFSRKLKDFGCVNERVLQIVNGLLIGVSKEGIWMKSGSDLPVDITTKITDKVNGYGIWDLISRSNWNTIAAGVRPNHGQYWLSLGTLDTVSGAPASAEQNVVIILDVKTGNWTYRTYQDQMLAFTNFIDTNGNRNLYGIGNTDSGVWEFETGTTDDDSAGAAQTISYEYRTPHHIPAFGKKPNPTSRMRIEKFFVQYIATNSVTVAQATNRGTYKALKSLDASSTVKVQDINPIPNVDGFSHSLKFTGTGKLILEGYGFIASEIPFTGIPAK